MKKYLWLLIALALCLSGCRESAEKNTTREPLPSEYKQVVENMSVVERRGGLPIFSLNAGTVIEFDNYYEFQRLSEVITYREGQAELKLRTKLANWHYRQGLLEAIGDVAIFGFTEDFMLEAPKVNYYAKEDTFETVGRSTLTTNKYKVYADRLSGDVEEQLLLATGDLLLVDMDGLEVRGSSLEFNWDTRNYKIKGPITAVVQNIE